MVHVFAFSLQDQVEKYGAYIGIAAFFGLAVLTILYFAQAKELRRLRDWAGRAPERAQEIEARAVAQAEAARRGQVLPKRTPPPARPAPAATAAGAAATAQAATAPGEQATQVVEPGEAAVQDGNGTAAAAAAAPEGEKPAEVANGNGDKGGAKAAGEAAKPAADEQAEGEPAEPDGEAKPEDEAAKPAAAAAAGAAGAAAAAKPGDGDAAPEKGEASEPGAAAQPDPSAKPEDAAKPDAAPEPAASQRPEPAAEDEHDEEPAEIPVAPVPRATPLPRRAPAPAAPLRQPNRSATLPPRRPAPAARGAAAKGQSGGGGSSWLVPALVGVGALVLVVAALFATGVLGGDDDTPSAPNTTSNATPGATAEPSGGEALTPASTKVAVLNGTTIPGLASREKDTLTDAGFAEIDTGNNTDQQRAESAVLYGTRSGARQQARTVAERLNITNVERLDADTRDLSEGADVVVILGQDKAP